MSWHAREAHASLHLYHVHCLLLLLLFIYPQAKLKCWDCKAHIRLFTKKKKLNKKIKKCPSSGASSFSACILVCLKSISTLGLGLTLEQMPQF